MKFTVADIPNGFEEQPFDIEYVKTNPGVYKLVNKRDAKSDTVINTGFVVLYVSSRSIELFKPDAWLGTKFYLAKDKFKIEFSN